MLINLLNFFHINATVVYIEFTLKIQYTFHSSIHQLLDIFFILRVRPYIYIFVNSIKLETKYKVPFKFIKSSECFKEEEW